MRIGRTLRKNVEDNDGPTTVVTISSASLDHALGIEPATARKLPKVLIIGDSVSLGFAPTVVAALEGKAVVRHNTEPVMRPHAPETRARP